ncbi:hypothetical protein AS156_06855 [Bradyrhizobium macuxiense]|uniref:Uncharacterized protein n=1 Tax=Bradyrhizobium macuxiense TaxID=1755647 RepID=A0A109JT52_9BRAD|nr:hypothetical protein AS156_06855 [Bradyrhizobium macuxiense]
MHDELSKDCVTASVCGAIRLGMEGTDPMVAIRPDELVPSFDWVVISVVTGRVIGEAGGRRTDVRAAAVARRTSLGPGRPVQPHCLIDPPAARDRAAETRQFGKSIRRSARAFRLHEERSQEFRSWNGI